ncbi:hypothetical protein FGIG_05131 [Fasciola gigantica]|uniref:Stabilizer of axonemal microtubules 2 n=1 Tax=Fasciola gigantica TaxID=46835 RepID=A0A504YG20_FASGI|nr:hypothetical protein FGIG_05131 [Fasciola gigantica]
MVRGGVQCICEICCCGHHKCPHQVKAIVPWGPCVMSEYTAQYHPHCPERTQPLVPPSNIFASGDPMSNRTTQRSDFVEHPYIHPYRYEPAPYKAPEGRIENITLYQNEFTQKDCPPVKSIKPIEQKMCSAKFDGQPTYRDDYRQWDLSPTESYKPSEARPPLAKFDGEPIYRREYVPKNMKPPETIKPASEIKLSNAPFNGETNYRTEFVPHEIEPRAATKPTLLSRPKVPFEQLTTNRKDYTAKQFCSNPPIIPENSRLLGTGPMSRYTTNRTDYKDWGPSYPERFTGPAYKEPQGDRYFGSTYRNDFSEVSPSPPPNELLPHECYSMQEPIKPVQNLVPLCPLMTRYKHIAQFVPKDICPCCPAGFLPTNDVSPDGFVFERIDERGHQLYKNVGTGKPMLPPVLAK